MIQVKVELDSFLYVERESETQSKSQTKSS